MQEAKEPEEQNIITSKHHNNVHLITVQFVSHYPGVSRVIKWVGFSFGRKSPSELFSACARYEYTAISRKVVGKKRKSARDNPER